MEKVIERVTGNKFYNYMKSEILNPIGMKHSSYIYDNDLNKFYAFGNENAVWKDCKVGRIMASGNLVSSANDMGIFMMYILKNYNNEILKEMWKVQNTNSILDFDKEQLLTWFTVNSDTIPKRKYSGHSGDGYPFHASTFFDFNNDLGITIMVNGMKGISNDLTDISKEIFKVIENNSTNEFLETSEKLYNTTRKDITLDLEDQLIGNWVGGTGIIRVFKRKNTLKMNLLGKDFNLYYHRNNEFSIGYKLYGIIPLNILNIENYSLHLENVNGQKYFQFMYLNDQVEILKKIDSSTINYIWLSRIGSKWECINSSNNDGISIDSATFLKDKESGLYCIEYNMGGYKILKPVSSRDNSHLYFLGVGRDLGETITYFIKENKEFLEYSGMLFKRVNKN